MKRSIINLFLFVAGFISFLSLIGDVESSSLSEAVAIKGLAALVLVGVVVATRWTKPEIWEQEEA